MGPNLIGWLGGGWVFLFDIERMRSQNFFGFVLGVAEVISLLHVSADSWRVDWVICSLSAEISGSWGSADLRLSRCSVRLWISGVRLAIKLAIKAQMLLSVLFIKFILSEL